MVIEMEESDANAPAFSTDASPAPMPRCATLIRCFNGTTRRTTDWDGLRKDDLLWDEEADCLVYFFTNKASKRGASMKIAFDAIEALKCKHLIDKCLLTHRQSQPPRSENNVSERGYTHLASKSVDLPRTTYELYIPAPPGLTRQQAYSYHLTTRNLMAYAIGSPLVGEKLSTALIDLWKRLQEWDVPFLLNSFTSYLEKQGYMDFMENAEHALACLKFAEVARLRDMWMESYVHCVGMHERLDLSPEFSGLGNTTIALISRASLEMDLHISRIVSAVGSFLEEELGPEYLGLSKPARSHLDHFRSFLHAFYVSRFGYFPPRETNPWNKRPWASMYHDFQNLYDYLVDTKSSSEWSNNHGLTGGVCVIQNVQTFDQRHGYTPLPHPLPLLPQMIAKQRSIRSPKSLRTLPGSRMHSASEQKVSTSQAIANATNSVKSEIMRCPLVQEYQRFERQKFDSKLEIAETRKVRWLLIYGVLQMLTSVMKAPQEVRDPETPSYPLCVLTTGCPPWIDGSGEEIDIEGDNLGSNGKMLVPEALDDLEGRSSRISIHPDCEADSAEAYFALNGISRQDSSGSLSSMNSPLKRSSSIRNSMHSSVQALSKSVVGSLSRRNSTRRASLPMEPKRMHSFCEIVVEDFADETETEVEEEPTRPPTAVRSGEVIYEKDGNALQAFDFGFVGRVQEPTLEHSQLVAETARSSSAGDDQEDTLISPCESDFSAISADRTDSNRSSYLADDDESAGTENSSWDGGSSRRDSAASIKSVGPEQKQLSYRPSNPNLGKKAGYTGVSAGCYTPTGMLKNNSLMSLSTERSLSAESLTSKASSVYVEEVRQAVDSKDVPSRWGRRSSDIESLAHYGIFTAESNVW